MSGWYNFQEMLPFTFAANFTTMTTRNLIYILTCLSFSAICGAAVYEHVVIWPKAFASIPASLTAFQGGHGLDNGSFWKMIHPITLVLFITAVILSWKTERKKHVLVPFIIYIGILATTFAWFVPELLDLIHTPFNNSHDETLTSRGSRWETLSIIRGIVLLACAIFLYLGLTKPAAKTRVAV
jgi:hypothetical protein